MAGNWLTIGENGGGERQWERGDVRENSDATRKQRGRELLLGVNDEDRRGKEELRQLRLARS